MNNFKIILSPKATKDFDNFSDALCMKIAKAVKILEENPFPKGKVIKKIKGKKTDFYRLRTDKYRIFYMIEGINVVILRVLSKKDAGKFIKSLN